MQTIEAYENDVKMQPKFLSHFKKQKSLTRAIKELRVEYDRANKDLSWAENNSKKQSIANKIKDIRNHITEIAGLKVTKDILGDLKPLNIITDPAFKTPRK